MPISSRPPIAASPAHTGHGAGPALARERSTELNWSIDLIEARSRSGGGTADERLLALFDVVHDLFRRDDPAARLFAINLAAITRAEIPAPEDMTIVLGFRQISMTLAAEAQLRDPAEFLLSFSLLLKGTVLKAAEGDLEAALRGRAMASDLLQRFRKSPSLSARCFEQAELLGTLSDFDFDVLVLPDILHKSTGEPPLMHPYTHDAATPRGVREPSTVNYYELEDQQDLETLETLEDIKWFLT